MVKQLLKTTFVTSKANISREYLSWMQMTRYVYDNTKLGNCEQMEMVASITMQLCPSLTDMTTVTASAHYSYGPKQTKQHHGPCPTVHVIPGTKTV